MTLDGRFAGPVSSRPRWPLKLALGAFALAVIVAGFAIGAVMLWIALWLLPVVLVAGVIGWVALKYQLWQLRRAQRGAPRDINPL